MHPKWKTNFWSGINVQYFGMGGSLKSSRKKCQNVDWDKWPELLNDFALLSVFNSLLIPNGGIVGLRHAYHGRGVVVDRVDGRMMRAACPQRWNREVSGLQGKPLWVMEGSIVLKVSGVSVLNSCLYLRFSFTGQPRLIWSCPKQISTAVQFWGCCWSWVLYSIVWMGYGGRGPFMGYEI